jgi:trimethylamine--corrinoid protein Co-methyltransferase
LVLGGKHTYVATDGCGARVLDPLSGVLRPATLSDLAQSARLADALTEFDLYWTMVSAQDVPASQRVVSEFVTAIRNTTKHVQIIDMARAKEAEQVARLTAVLTGTGVVEAPAASALISVVSPLRLDPEGTEAALVMAGAGLPVVCCSMPIAGITAPPSVAGNLALAHAEVLGLVTIIQTLRPGAPVIYCSFASYANPRTGTANYDDPRAGWTAAAAAELGRSSGIPCFSSGGLLAMLARPDLTSGGGLLETSTVLAYEQMVTDAEVVRDLRRASAAPEVTTRSLALDAIRDVGPGGHFLASRDTLRQMREVPETRFGDRESARREAARLMKTHEVEAFPSAINAALDEILSRPAAVSA